MQEKKLGRGIEEISHYFIPSKAKEEEVEGKKRRWISIDSCGKGMQKDFLIFNLSFEIAAQKKRVVIFNQCTHEPEASLFMKPFNQEVSGENKSKFYRIKELPEGFGDILIVPSNHIMDCYGTLSTQHSAPNTPQSEIRNQQSEIVLDNIENQLGTVDIIFLNTPPELITDERSTDKLCRENIIITSPEEKEMMWNYSLIKKICETNPSSCIGLIVNKVKKVSEAIRTFKKIARITSKYLNKQILSFGFFYDDLIITRSILEGTSLVLSYPDTRLRRCLQGISELIINDGNDGNNGNDGTFNASGFFEKTVPPSFRSGIIENNLSLEEALEFIP